MRIVLPEMEEGAVAEAVEQFRGSQGTDQRDDLGRGENDEVELVGAENLEEAAKAVGRGEADALVAGARYTTREVILAVRDFVGLDEGRPGTGKTFSSCFLMSRGEEKYIVADAGVTKNPTAEQLYDIVIQTAETARILLGEEPRVAMLSFSTLGSADKDPVLDKIREVTRRLQEENETEAEGRNRTKRGLRVVGEIQLDAAIDAEVARKKGVEEGFSPANVLIVPDLTSGNILYKAMERFGGFTAAGPILQGFKKPCSDLSRGSSAEDVLAAIRVVQKIVASRSEER